MKKVILITNIPTPYRIPFFNELHKQMENNDLKLKVVFGAQSYPRRKWKIDLSECKFEYVFLQGENIHFIKFEKTIFMYYGLLKIINTDDPDLIIIGGFSIATIKIYFYSFLKHIPYIIWSGLIERKSYKESFVKKIQQKILSKRAKGFIVYGNKAKNYLTSLGVNENKIFISINTVDTKYFNMKAMTIKKKLKDKKDKKYLLYIGHLTKGKCVDKLFYAIKLLTYKRNDFKLILVGSGAAKNELILLAKRMGLMKFITFEGYKQREHIPYFLAQADVFIFPSEYDIWGLVLIEAMSANLPCIASIYAGATHDLIKDGVNGFAMDFSEAKKVSDKINWIIENPSLSKQIGLNAGNTILQCATLEKSAKEFLKAIIKTLCI